MLQIDIFATSAPADPVPDSTLNDSGVLYGARLTRIYGEKYKSHIEIRLAHIGPRWCYGLSVQAGHTGSGHGPSFKWNEFASADDALQDALASAEASLKRKSENSSDKCVIDGAAAMLHALSGGDYTERLVVEAP